LVLLRLSRPALARNACAAAKRKHTVAHPTTTSYL
jgi:hypothetical protein